MPDRSAPAAGRWVIDPHHSHVGFAVRRRGMATLRARFTSVSGHLDITSDLADSCLALAVVTSSVDSGSAACDHRLRSPEHLDVTRHPTATFRSARASWTGRRVWFHGRLTIVGVLNEVDVDVDFRGAIVDSSGAARIALSGTSSIDREEWGLSWNLTLANGHPLVERVVDLHFELEVVRQPASLTAASRSDTGRR